MTGEWRIETRSIRRDWADLNGTLHYIVRENDRIRLVTTDQMTAQDFIAGQRALARVAALEASMREIQACLDHLYTERNGAGLAMLPGALAAYAGPLSIIDRLTAEALAPGAGDSPGEEV